MKLKGTKKNKIAKNRSRKQKVTKTKQAKLTKTFLQKSKTKWTNLPLGNLLLAKGLKTYMKIMSNPASSDINSIISKFIDISEFHKISQSSIIGYELEFQFGCYYYTANNIPTTISKTDRIPFHPNVPNLVLSGDYDTDNEFIETEKKIGISINHPELIGISSILDFSYIESMFLAMFIRILYGSIQYIDENVIIINIGGTYVGVDTLIVINNKFKKTSPSISIKDAVLQCTINIPLIDVSRILDICIVLKLPDIFTDIQIDESSISYIQLQILVWCKKIVPSNQFQGFMIYYYICILNFYTRDEDDTSDYGKAYLPFALRENFIEILIALSVVKNEVDIMRFKTLMKDDLLRLTPLIVERFGNTLFKDKVVLITQEICNDVIDDILGDFCETYSVQKLPITIDGVSAIKMEFRQLHMDKTVKTFINTLTTKLVFDIKKILEIREMDSYESNSRTVLSVLDYASLEELSFSKNIPKIDPGIYDKITTEFDEQHDWS